MKIFKFPALIGIIFPTFKAFLIKVEKTLFWKLNLRMFGLCALDFHIEDADL